MKNVITLDTEEGLVPELNVISTAENAIYFRIYNPGTSAKLEIYYGCDYKKTLSVTTKDIQIPTEYVSDAGMIHVRYVDSAIESKFVHILGNENLYKELKLEKRTTFLYSCAGAKKTGLKVKEITLDEYLDVLSKNPVTNAAITAAISEVQTALIDIKSKTETDVKRCEQLRNDTKALNDEFVKKLASGEYKGAQGTKGDRGLQGVPGPQGLQGEKGDTGARGPQGVQGEKGDTGVQGPQGLQGEKGDTGPRGVQGPQGEKGDTGVQGPQGIQGEKGEKGEKGERGDSGITTTINGFFTLVVDENGNLYALCTDDDNPPQFETDDEGNVYFILPDE